MKKINILIALAMIAAFPCLLTGCCNQNTTQMNENPVIDAIMARRSIRHYTDAPVEREKLQKIVECGINAPNALNRQEWEVRIVDDKAYFDGATEIMKDVMPFFVKKDEPKFRNGFRNCTAAIFIACPDDKDGMLLMNVGLMGENICLAAQSLGLGTCFMGGPAMFLNNTPEAKPYLDKLGFSEGYILRAVIAVGYPDEQPEAKPRDIGKIKFINHKNKDSQRESTDNKELVFDNFKWTREPASFAIKGDTIEVVTAEKTDLWQRTYYHFQNDNAPVLQMETQEKFFSFVVKTDFTESHHRFDQCGVVMYLDSENWMKGSVEYENDQFQHLGSVVTNNGYSDWATTAIPADVKQMWYRLSRREDDFCIECSQDGVNFSQMRVCHIHKATGNVQFGIYACSPEESSFKAVFTDMKLTECAWKPHDGQQADY